MKGRLFNIAQVMRRTGLPRESLCLLRLAGLITPVEMTPLGRMLFAANVFGRIERIEELKGLGMSLEEVAEVFANDVDDMQPAPMLMAEPCMNGGPKHV